MSQDETGGYCSKCDVVWAAPGRCRCQPKIKMTVKGNCGQIHTFEEWQKCEACQNNPLMHLEKSMHELVWNAAIEAAAKMIDDMGEEARISEYIRELKK